MAVEMALFGYCGIYCGDCPNYTHSISNPAKELRKELRRCNFDKIALTLSKMPDYQCFNNYHKFYELLEAMINFQCNDCCKRGGGCHNCQIRKCAKSKGLDGCWQCDEFSSCEMLEKLKAFDSKQTYMRNLRKIKRQGLAAFAKQKK
jgi:hypothetical protein